MAHVLVGLRRHLMVLKHFFQLGSVLLFFIVIIIVNEEHK